MNAIPTADAASRREAKRPWPRRLVNGAALLLLLVALAIGFTHLLGFYMVQQELRRMRWSGEPMTLQELFDARPEVPDEQNSALVVLALRDEMAAAMSLAHSWDRLPIIGGERRRFSMDEPWLREEVDHLCAFVAQHRPLLDRLDAIQSMPMGRYPLNAKPDLFTPSFDNRSPVRNVSRLQTVAACADLIDGQPGAALDRCVTMLNTSRPLLDEPMLISALTASACDGLAMSTIEGILALATVDAPRLQRVEAILLEHERKSDRAAALRGQRLWVREYFRHLDQMLATYTKERLADYNIWYLPPARVLRWTGLARVNEARCLQLSTRLVESNDDPQWALWTSNEVASEWYWSGPLYGLSRVLWSDPRRPIELAVVDRVRLSCARTGLAAERYRMDHGHWPADLAALVPGYLDAVPVDHFDGQALRLKQTDEGLLVYSVGEDGVDDGGDRITRKNRRPADLGFFVRDPALRGLQIVETLDNDESSSFSE